MMTFSGKTYNWNDFRCLSWHQCIFIDKIFMYFIKIFTSAILFNQLLQLLVIDRVINYSFPQLQLLLQSTQKNSIYSYTHLVLI